MNIESAIENSVARFIELLATGAAPEASATLDRPLVSFRRVRSATLHAPHCTVLHPGRRITLRVFTGSADPNVRGGRTSISAYGSCNKGYGCALRLHDCTPILAGNEGWPCASGACRISFRRTDGCEPESENFTGRKNRVAGELITH